MPPHSPVDESFMRRALRLAMNGRGYVEPNPMVACVLVKDGRVIGEGHHAKYGGPHAEPAALANCTESPKGATAYVTLEPCCHTNKKTPPCAPRLIEAKVKRVVIGCLDPNPEVNGNGVGMLRAAGITVDGPVLEGEAKQLIAPFIVRTRLGRPYVTLKWAESSDGKIAGANGRPVRISSELSTRVVHELRSRCDAIMVGIATVLTDDPLLTVRGVQPLRTLTRVVLDADLALPTASRLVRTVAQAPLHVFCYEMSLKHQASKVDELRRRGVVVRTAAFEDPHRVSLADVLRSLSTDGMAHVVVESGGGLALSVKAAELVDRLWVFRSPRPVNEPDAPIAGTVPKGYVVTGECRLQGDQMTEYLNPRGDAYFAPEPSADFALTWERHRDM